MNEGKHAALVDETDAWAALNAELQNWRQAGLRPRMFLRDDDAVDDTIALNRLLDLCGHHQVPLLLAIIPKPATPALARCVERHCHITPAVHGFGHIDHSPPGEKICELGLHRPVDIVLGELKQGRRLLMNMFRSEISSILVPPWNRIDPVIRARVGDVGFAAVSAHGWPVEPTMVPALNTHVDIIHWSGGQVGRQLTWVLQQLNYHLLLARKRDGQAIGLLTHHLAHDQQAWSVLETVFEWSRHDDGVEWVAADSLIEEAETAT